MRRYRLQNREGDRAEVRLEGITLDGELHGDPLRVYGHLLPPKAPTNAEEAEDALLHVLRGLGASGWKVFDADEDGIPLSLPTLAKVPPEDAGWRALGIHPSALEEVVIDSDAEESGVRPVAILRDPRLDATRKLWIWHWGADGLDYRPWVKAFPSRSWPALRSLVLGHGPDRYQTAQIGPLTAAHWQAAPRLEDVDVSGTLRTLEPLVLPSLRTLRVSSFDAAPKAVMNLLGSAFPLLEALHLEIADGLALATLRTFLGRQDLPRLRTLRLGPLHGNTGLSARLLRAPWLTQLTSLSFEVQYPDDADRQALVEAAPRLAHLEKLTVSSSLRPPEGLHPRLEITTRF